MNAPRCASAHAQLAAARTRLIVDKPFIGVLLLHLPLEAVDWCGGIATDARRIYYNPDYIARLDARQTQFVLAHQALHCALGHFARRGHRLRGRWDAACDLAVNLLLVEEGLDPVPDARVDPALRGLSAEEIYPLLGDDAAARGFDVHLFDIQAASMRPRTRDEPQASPHAPRPGEGLAMSADALDSDAAPLEPGERGAGAHAVPR